MSDHPILCQCGHGIDAHRDPIWDECTACGCVLLPSDIARALLTRQREVMTDNCIKLLTAEPTDDEVFAAAKEVWAEIPGLNIAMAEKAARAALRGVLHAARQARR